MDIIETLINSVPEPLATAILTAAFTGVIIFLFQKRIERSNNRQLEEFKAALQRSSVEYQIKFSKTYPRTLEILETGHQKLRDLAQLFQQTHRQILYSQQLLELSEIKAKVDEAIAAVREYTVYFHNNRLYIPDELIAEIEKINSRVGALGLASMSILDYANKPLNELMKQTGYLSQMVGSLITFAGAAQDIDEAASKRQWFYLMSSAIDLTFVMLTHEFEKLYKSVAEAQ